MGRFIRAFRIIIFQNKKGGPETFYRFYGLFNGISGNSLPYLHVIKNPISLIDIDMIEDFFLAEEIIKRKLFNFDSEDLIDSNHPHIT